MKFKRVTKRDKLNESLVSEDKYQEFILGMMGELGGSKFFTAGICPDDWFEDMPYEEEAFRSFSSAREWCERTLRQYDKGSIAYIVKSNIDSIHTNVVLAFDGKDWYFYNRG